MSSTRRVQDETEFHPNRYASSREFERGLPAKLVAMRVTVLGKKADRDLIWFLQYLSHRDGGLAAVAAQMLNGYQDRIGTRTMLQVGKLGKQDYGRLEVKSIRSELPAELRMLFALQGETEEEIYAGPAVPESRNVKPGLISLEPPSAAEFARRAARLRRQAEAVKSLHAQIENRAAPALKPREVLKQPDHYPVKLLLDFCCVAATKCRDGKMTALEKVLWELCLDPAVRLDAGGPWYFAALVDVLRDYQGRWTATKKAAAVVTSLGQKINDVLDHTQDGEFLSLTEGAARTGKTFAAKAWCEQRPGAARFVEVPPFNDEAGFFRALARGLGLGNFLQYKAAEIRERVESVLLTRDLTLVLDEAQRLWPQRNLRYGYPSRMVWVMAMANQGVSIGMIATQQFTTIQKAIEKGGWNSAQLTGRIYRYESLPGDLTEKDLAAVAKSVLPEAEENCLRALVVYASRSARYLAAIDSISKHARYLAKKSGRDKVTTADVRAAMNESVIPADTKLKAALDSNGRKKLIPPAASPLPESEAQDAGERDPYAERLQSRPSAGFPSSRTTLEV